MIEVNGKVYPMWSQFVEQKEKWLGGILQELEDSYPRMDDGSQPSTKITDVRLEPNGKESAYFFVDGEDFGCGGDVKCLGIYGGDKAEDGWITLSGYGGHLWRIKPKS